MYSNPFIIKNATSANRCCGFISLRFGCGLICLIWAAFSMYLAVISFQNSSLFYSYMPSAPITVYGVCNLILSLVSVGGIFLIIYDVSRYIKGLSHAIFVSVFLVLVDTFINLILFITYKDQYSNSCITSSSNKLSTSLNNSSLSNDFLGQDYYNCHNLWQDELKFSIIFFILMLAFYVYWALCIASYAMVREVSYISDGDLRHIPSDVMMNPNLPPQPGMPLPGAFNPNERPGFNNDRSIIVLNNARPHKKTSHDTMVDHKRDSQFTINFRYSPEGRKMDIENAPSPTPTYFSPQQMKRKPIQDEKEDILFY